MFTPVAAPYAGEGDGVYAAKSPKANTEWSCRAWARIRAEDRNAAPSVIAMVMNCVYKRDRRA
jgi:hypothetical protein